MNTNSNSNSLKETKKLNKESAQKAAQTMSNYQMEAGTESYLEETKKLNAKSKNAASSNSNSSSTSSSN